MLNFIGQDKDKDKLDEKSPLMAQPNSILQSNTLRDIISEIEEDDQ